MRVDIAESTSALLLSDGLELFADANRETATAYLLIGEDPDVDQRDGDLAELLAEFRA